MKLIVGLGNPGSKYEGSRHNVGFLVVDRLGGGKWEEKSKFKSLVWVSPDKEFMLVKPQTFMNKSGEAVRAVMRFYKLGMSDLWVVYDDIELPVGVVKIQPGGKRANHNGVQSVVEALGTGEFGRFRLGVGWDRRFEKEAWVLGRFASEERPVVVEAVERLVGGVRLALSGGIEKAMNEVN